MNEREVGELRRRFRPDKTGVTRIRGCYVNEKKEIVSEFSQALGLMTEDEQEKMLTLLKKALSGSLGKNLIDLSFSTAQVQDSPEHRLLTALRDGEEEAVHRFFETVKEALTLEGSYLILLAQDAYDVPFRGKDGAELDDGSETVFRYVLCSICPVRLAKPALTYSVTAGELHNRASDWLVSPPETGFLFPAFDNRGTNLYGALLYSRDAGNSREDLVEAVFHTRVPMAALEQRETFHTLLADALEEECSFDTVQAVQGQLCAMIQEHKESKVPEPLTVTKGTVKGVLASCGVSPEHVEAFGSRYDESFGADTDLSPRNLVDPRLLEVKTPDVTVRVSPERSDLVETRVLGGVKYILIRADEGVELNGVDIRIGD